MTTAEATQATALVELRVERPAPDTEVKGMVEYAHLFVITSAETSASAIEARKLINQRIAMLEDARKKLTAPIDAAKKAIMDFFRPDTDALEAAKKVLDVKVIAYDTEQARITRELQRKAEAEAQAERRRLQEEAEAIERKARAEVEAKRRDAEAAAAQGRVDEAAKLAAQAATIETKAQTRIEAKAERIASVVAPILQPATQRVAGSTFRDNWKWRLVDIADVKPSFTKTITRDTVIDAIVKANPADAAVLVGGIEVYNDRQLATSRRA